LAIRDVFFLLKDAVVRKRMPATFDRWALVNQLPDTSQEPCQNWSHYFVFIQFVTHVRARPHTSAPKHHTCTHTKARHTADSSTGYLSELLCVRKCVSSALSPWDHV